LGNHYGMIVPQATTIPEMFAETVSRRADEPALGFIRAGELHWRTWRQVFDEAARLAARIRAIGIEPGDRVVQVSENRYEWIITDLALHLAGAVHVPVHITLSGEQMAAQIADSGARLVFVSHDELLTRFAALIDPAIPVWRHNGPQTIKEEGVEPFDLVAKTQAEPDDVATILYTSGTTGHPRGVVLNQRNLASNASAVTDAFGFDENQLRLNILPLSHIYARTCDLYTWVYRGCRLVLAESRETLGRDCQLVRPTSLNAVPYVYQKIADRIRAAGGDDATEAKNLSGYFGGRIEMLCCGGAPIAPDVEKWYAERGLTIYPGYGLTETSPVISVSTPEASRFGSVGRPLGDVEVRIAADGEILTRGPHVMRGYWRNDAATAEIIRDGWLHTGDLGRLDADGFLTIQGRKKEMIALCTGKKVHPASIESRLNASPLIEQSAVFGEGKSCLVALIVLATGDNSNQDEIAREIASRLQSNACEEQIRSFAILDRPFSIERGELTPKLSLCRSVIATNFQQEITALYENLAAGEAKGESTAMPKALSV
jgi:long-chain acyl-CoA synthetase